jgi:hypothetical protein
MGKARVREMERGNNARRNNELEWSEVVAETCDL